MALRLLIAILILAGLAPVVSGGDSTSKNQRVGLPNILWITAEDMSANLGCYGDGFASTPNLDHFATQSVRYTHAFATAPVCSPARSCLITGVYASSLGTQRLRSAFPLPDPVRGFPAYLRRVGYFTTNNVKTDYNVAAEAELIQDSWDRNAADAHWRQREPGQPFFSVFNFMTTHQSRSNVWPTEQFEREVAAQLTATERHDPQRVVVPEFYPDTPLVRKTLARYYDCIAVMDKQVGELLAQLDADGLTENTIVFFYSDHGMGLPRGKRLLHDTGMHVPLLIRVPPAFRTNSLLEGGTESNELISFVDFAPTVLRLAGVEPPEYMQGRSFLGSQVSRPREFVFGCRDRVDEAYDLSRSVRDGQHLYIRNYLPQLSWMQPEWYSDQAEMRQHLRQWQREGRMNAAQKTYSAPRKAVEEFYDTKTDPLQLHNLADSPKHRDQMNRMRKALAAWQVRTRDVGFLPEADVWNRLDGLSPWDLARDESRCPLEEILLAANSASRDVSDVDGHLARLTASDGAVRYWGAIGLQLSARGTLDSRVAAALRRALTDDSPPVRLVAASVLLQNASSPHASIANSARNEAMATLTAALEVDEVENVLQATRVLEMLGDRATPALPALKRVFRKSNRLRDSHPCWLFVQFSADAAMWHLEPNANRPRMRL